MPIGTTNLLSQPNNSLERVINITVGVSPSNISCKFYVHYCTNLQEKAWVEVNSNGFMSSTNGPTIVSHTNSLPQAYYRASSEPVVNP